MPSVTDLSDPTPKLPSFYLDTSQVRDSGLLTPQRMAELDAEIDRRISLARDDQGQAITSHRLADLSPYGRYLYPYMPHEEVPFAYARRQVLAAILTDAERDMLSKHALGISSAKREAERFTKAQHILEENWPDGVFYGDDYYASTDDLHDMIADEDMGEDEVVYAWAAKPQRVIYDLDVEDVVGHIVDDRGWEDMNIDDLNGVEALQSALDAFVKANEPVVSYEIDYTKAIILTREVEQQGPAT